MHAATFQFNKWIPTELWLVTTICAILGALFGLYIVCSWSEAVEFAQVWAGLVTYPRDNPWGQAILGDSSLQISLPALLLYYGVGPWPLSLASTTFSCVSAFIAAGTLSFALTRQVPIAIIGSLALLTYNFANPFGYWTSYPFHICHFGQTGQYLCIIALAFMACRHYKSGSIIGSSLAAIHPVWWIAYLLGVFPVLFFMDRRQFKRVAVYTVAASLLWVLLHKLCLSLLPTIEAWPKNPTLSGIHTNADFSRPIRKTFEVHNILLGDSPTPWLSAIGMFLPVVLWVIFSSIYVLVVRRQTIKPPATSGIIVLAMAILPLCCATLYQCVEEIDPSFNLLAKLDPHISDLLLRAIINRWFNFVSFMLPLLPLAILAVLTINHRSFLALSALAYLLYFTRQPWVIGIPYSAYSPEIFSLYMPPHGLFFIAVALLATFNRWEPKPNLPHITKFYPTVLWVMCLIITVHYCVIGWNSAIEKKRELDAGKFDQIIATAKQEKGSIIYAPDMRLGEQGFLRLMVNRPSILEFYISVKTPYADIYCYTNPKERFQWMARIQTCFEGRTKNEWVALAQRTHATALIVPETWKLALIPALTSGGLNYYRLTNTFRESMSSPPATAH